MSAIIPLPQVLEENERLRAENDVLKSELVAREVSTPADWKLTKVEQQIFQMMLKTEVVTKQAIVAVLYGANPSSSVLKNLDVFIARIRAKTRDEGVNIETIVSVGYRLSDRDEWLKALKH